MTSPCSAQTAKYRRKIIYYELREDIQKIIKDLSLEINDGETHAIMGPNGTGKSTLAKVIMGHYLFTLTGGEIFFNETKLNALSTDERAKLGIFLAMQDPTVIDGVTNSEFLKTSSEEITGKHIDYFKFIENLPKDKYSFIDGEYMVVESLEKEEIERLYNLLVE